VSGSVFTGRSVVVTIHGTNFDGRPKVTSNAGHTVVQVLDARGTEIVVRVTVARSTPRGVHTFTLVFARGKTSVKYEQR
jgi:hypothetical protein